MTMNKTLPTEIIKNKTPLVSVVVAVFRNADSLVQLYEEITKVALRRFPQLELEIVFVDDGSDDNSWDVISHIKSKDPSHISSHRLTRNFGQVSAMVSGFGLAQGDAVVSISADLQDPTELIGDMVDKWLSGDDVVIANRLERSDGRFAALTSRIAYAYARRVVKGIPKGGFDYFLMSRRVLTQILNFQGRFRFIQGDLLWLGFPTSFIPYSRAKRTFGKSGYSFRRRLSYFVDLVLDSSYGPIKFMSRIGVLSALFGLIYAIVIVFAWFDQATPFDGWAPIMVVLLITSGLILITLGTIGAYIWRIYDQLRVRPMSVLLESSFPEKEKK
jgi:glycosyltransferase involved in cell wall biosynthesis